MATQGPTPVDIGTTTIVVTGPLDRFPDPVPAGPGSTGQIPTVKKPLGPPESAPPAVTPGPGTGQIPGTSTVTFVPVVELPVEIPIPADQGNNVIPTVPNLIEVLANGVIVVQNASALNFTGSGVTVTASGSTATLNITSGGSSYGNSNVSTFLAGFGSNTISTTGNVTGGYILGNGSQLTGIAASYGNANVVANLAALGTNPVSTTGNVTGGNLTTAGIANIASLAVTGSATVQGSISIFSTSTSFSATGNVIVGNVLTGGLISATGNVTGNYFIGNGSLLTGISAGANTGNVTFSGETVIGTGTSNLISGLYLAPSSSSANASMYLRVRGNINDEPTHIHFDTGNNAYYNQFIGDDNKYIQLANTGNIIINSNDGAGNSAQWIFDAAGGTIFPTLTTQRGDEPASTITGQTLLFGDRTQEAVISTLNGNVDYISSQRLVINPGEGFESGEGGDIYLWAGRGGNTSGSGGDIKIRGGQGGTIGGGIGGAGGYIRMEAGNSTDAGAPGFVEITGGWGADSGQGGNITITTGDSNAVSGNVLIYSGVLGWTIGNDGKITLPHGASLNDTSGDSVAFGQNAGLTSQAQHAVAIGINAGRLYQGEDSIAIGYNAGYRDQQRGVAIGWNAGQGGQLYRSVSDLQGGSGPVTTYDPVQAPNPSRLYVASTADIVTSQRVFGNNIQANTVVTAVYAGEDRVDISPDYTAAMSNGDPLTFVGLVIGINDASNIVVGMRATGTDIPANTFVQSTGCSVVTLNQYPTAPLADSASIVFSVGQGFGATAVGYQAGQSFQGDDAVAVGRQAGYTSQNDKTVAVGGYAGYNVQGNAAVAVGYNAGQGTQGINAVAVGYKAGQNTQGARAVAIGEDAGYNTQGEDAVAVGQKAGFASQGIMAIAIGNTAGYSGQTQEAVAIGYGTGLVSQQYAAVAIGANAASYNQGSSAVAVGRLAGNTSQGSSAVAVGDSAGYNYQSGSAVAVGVQSGYNYQSQYAVAIGSAAGQGQGYSAVYQSGTGTAITITPNAYIQIGQRITGEYVPADTYVADIDGASLTLSQAITGTPAVDTVWTAWGQQGISAVAIGQNAALDFQGNNAVAIGTDSGSSNQSANAVAIGYRAGFEAQGSNTVSIGTLAGQSAQGNNSIILNATGVAINSTGANTFTVAPVRNDVANTGEVVFYNTTSKEITYGNVISVAGNITAGNLSAVNLVINSIRSDDSTFVTIEDGVNISSGAISSQENLSLTANAYTWTFRNDGIGIVLPYSATIRDTNIGALAIGYQAGFLSQANTAVAIGYQAGLTSQGGGAVAIGRSAGNSQSDFAVAIGSYAGVTNQGNAAVAVGYNAGQGTQGINAVAVGSGAGLQGQGTYSVAIGYLAGNNTQGGDSVAVGVNSGGQLQGAEAVAIGTYAGYISQGNLSVAVGRGAGENSQGANSVAVGTLAGRTNQANNSIILNATGANLEQTTANTFTVKPVRGDSTSNLVSGGFKAVYYNSTTGEFAYTTD